jgi:hypothetical protein
MELSNEEKKIVREAGYQIGVSDAERGITRPEAWLKGFRKEWVEGYKQGYIETQIRMLKMKKDETKSKS